MLRTQKRAVRSMNPPIFAQAACRPSADQQGWGPGPPRIPEETWHVDVEICGGREICGNMWKYNLQKSWKHVPILKKVVLYKASYSKYPFIPIDEPISTGCSHAKGLV
jgi:hypothetical protein